MPELAVHAPAKERARCQKFRTDFVAPGPMSIGGGHKGLRQLCSAKSLSPAADEASRCHESLSRCRAPAFSGTFCSNLFTNAHHFARPADSKRDIQRNVLIPSSLNHKIKKTPCVFFCAFVPSGLGGDPGSAKALLHCSCSCEFCGSAPRYRRFWDVKTLQALVPRSFWRPRESSSLQVQGADSSILSQTKADASSVSRSYRALELQSL